MREFKNKSLDGVLTDDTGRDLKDAEARKYLADCLLDGWRVLPTGGCPTHDYQKGCQCNAKH